MTQPLHQSYNVEKVIYFHQHAFRSSFSSFDFPLRIQNELFMNGKQENAQRSGFKTFDFMRRSKLETLKTWPRDEFNLVFNIYGVFFVTWKSVWSSHLPSFWQLLSFTGALIYCTVMVVNEHLTLRLIGSLDDHCCCVVLLTITSRELCPYWLTERWFTFAHLFGDAKLALHVTARWRFGVDVRNPSAAFKHNKNSQWSIFVLPI